MKIIGISLVAPLMVATTDAALRGSAVPSNEKNRQLSSAQIVKEHSATAAYYGDGHTMDSEDNYFVDSSTETFDSRTGIRAPNGAFILVDVPEPQPLQHFVNNLDELSEIANVEDKMENDASLLEEKTKNQAEQLERAITNLEQVLASIEPDLEVISIANQETSDVFAVANDAIRNDRQTATQHLDALSREKGAILIARHRDYEEAWTAAQESIAAVKDAINAANEAALTAEANESFASAIQLTIDAKQALLRETQNSRIAAEKKLKAKKAATAPSN